MEATPSIKSATLSRDAIVGVSTDTLPTVALQSLEARPQTLL